ncbi:MAG: alanine--glyoxylate aminotransferase family protein [Betaproteobacteria bacterium]|nr:alanine--glyoxylate aminotransferase family protein [Betaproteobacteria bacterium]
MSAMYPIPMLPGPVSVPDEILAAMRHNYPSGDLETDFFKLYAITGRGLARLMGTRNDVVIMTGEGMLVLWAALKSCLKPGDKVLAAVTGIFGDGLGDMAAGIGCEVRKFCLDYNKTLGDLAPLEKMLEDFSPDMIIAVHCETPSGTLNPLEDLGRIARQHGSLFCVDAVSSIGGVDIQADAWGIDVLLGGSQKCLSAPPSMSFLSISPPAWERIERTGYQGYDALIPWRSIDGEYTCPYTPYWHGLAALHAGVQRILREGPERVFARHGEVALQCRDGLQELGIELWPAPDSTPAPTVTAALVPTGITWHEWRARLRARGLVVGGSLGPLAGKVFRLGHMGSQAEQRLMTDALAVLREAL